MSYRVEVGPLSREEVSSMHFITKCRSLFPLSSAGILMGGLYSSLSIGG